MFKSSSRIRDGIKLALTGKLEIREGDLPSIFVYKNYIEIAINNKSRYISGFIIYPDINLDDDREDTLRIKDSEAIFLSKSFENLLYSLQLSKIPIVYLYSSLPERDGRFESSALIITFSDSEDGLVRNLDIVEMSFRSVFPNYGLRRVSGRDLLRVLSTVFTAGVDGPGLDRPLIPFKIPEPTRGSSWLSPEFYIPNAEEGSGTILLGRCKGRGNEEVTEIRLRKEDLTTHLVVLGSTGSGKTTTTATLLNRLSREGVKYLVLDWGNEYSGLVGDTVDIVYTPGTTDEFSINPLLPAGFEDRAEHLAMVTDIFSDVYNFTHPQSYMFKEALNLVLERYEGVGEEVPSLKTLVVMLEKLPIRSYFDVETKLALMRRLKPLTEGQAGRAFCGKRNIGVNEIMERNVVIELGHFRETRTRQIFAQLLLKQIYDYVLLRRASELRHVTVIEEGRYVVPARRHYDPPSTTERMIAELRKFGEAVFVVAQFPSQISTEIVKNSGCLIVHRLGRAYETEILRNVMPLTPKQVDHLRRLEIGEAVAKIGRLGAPVLVKVKPEISSTEEVR